MPRAMMLSGAHLPVPNAVLLKPPSCPSRGTGRKYECRPVRCGREQLFLTANIFHNRLACSPVAWSLAAHRMRLRPPKEVFLGSYGRSDAGCAVTSASHT